MAGRWLWAALSTLLATLALLLTPGCDGGSVAMGGPFYPAGHTGIATNAGYSPRSNSSRIDGCMDANFTEEQIESGSCDLGCESVTVYDINEEIESFHRNCATNDTIMTNTCETYTTRVLIRRVCSCDFSYCNSASSLRWTGLIGVVSLAAVLCLGST